jgi:hypothetical protein
MTSMWQREISMGFRSRVFSLLPSNRAPTERQRKLICSANGYPKRRSHLNHPAILRLQGLDALGDIPIIDVATVNFGEMPQSGGLVAC